MIVELEKHSTMFNYTYNKIVLKSYKLYFSTTYYKTEFHVLLSVWGAEDLYVLWPMAYPTLKTNKNSKISQSKPQNY